MSHSASAAANSINFALAYNQPKPSDKITCQYQNDTSVPQVICISNIEEYSFERTVLPKQKLLFETFAEAVLEIRTGVFPTAIVGDRIPCLRLRTVTPLPIWPSYPKLTR